MPIDNAKPKTKSYYNIYATAFVYTSVSSVIGYPFEVLKVRLQTNPEKSSISVAKQVFAPPLKQVYTGLNTYLFNRSYLAKTVKLSFHSNVSMNNFPLIGQPLKQLYAGFTACLFRQCSKLAYRPLLLTTVPAYIEQFSIRSPLDSVYQGLTACIIKGLIGSFLDTAAGVSLENIKTVQMRNVANQQSSATSAVIRSIYQQPTGIRGFFKGSVAMWAKSAPSWLNLFIAYQLVDSKREKQSFLSTIFWAMAAATPITVLTTPMDTIKSRQQSSHGMKQRSLVSTASHIYKNYGIPRFFRGLGPRIFVKGLNTGLAFAVLDVANKMYNNTSETTDSMSPQR